MYGTIEELVVDGATTVLPNAGFRSIACAPADTRRDVSWDKGASATLRTRRRTARDMPPVAKALKDKLETLQGLLDEGFITGPEFKQRRQALLDAATAPAKSGSVFSRLGGSSGAMDATGSTGGDSSQGGGAWGKKKFASGASKIAARAGGGAGSGGRTVIGGGIRKPGDLRNRLGGAKPSDLRSMLSGGAQKGQKQQKGRVDLRQMLSAGGGGAQKGQKNSKRTVQLPEACPW